ncbi:SDR family NAD(P)-dependent oxidoreductase [Microbaculum marinisediminis]|uniref:SDR family oxidoreductase n=1 Tax=Microbaculum marinisediminis TaxID=2931392 RepID=A0AAW5R3G8_9HYPH|nr:SDR family oxidoreductase [Microbaculum sp. A6E488]MCT8973198.1 SDR family oxidoreductase [Microbaculum sp. A6E488]
MERRLENRIAVVTGASRGIGRAAAIALAREGAHIIAIARTTGALEELDDEIRKAGSSATLVPFSLADMAAIDRLGGAIHKRWGKLDILVGNAGIAGALTPVGHIRAKDWDEAIAVNLTANWRLIRSLDPLMRQSDAARAVFVTSGLAHMGQPYHSAYAASKAGLELLARTYAAEVEQFGIKVNLFGPGRVFTRMQQMLFRGQDLSDLPKPEDVAPAIVEMVLPAQTHNGLIYSFPQKTWLRPQPPAPIDG